MHLFKVHTHRDRATINLIGLELLLCLNERLFNVFFHLMIDIFFIVPCVMGSSFIIEAAHHHQVVENHFLTIILLFGTPSSLVFRF